MYSGNRSVESFFKEEAESILMMYNVLSDSESMFLDQETMIQMSTVLSHQITDEVSRLATSNQNYALSSVTDRLSRMELSIPGNVRRETNYFPIREEYDYESEEEIDYTGLSISATMPDYRPSSEEMLILGDSLTMEDILMGRLPESSGSMTSGPSNGDTVERNQIIQTLTENQLSQPSRSPMLTATAASSEWYRNGRLYRDSVPDSLSFTNLIEGSHSGPDYHMPGNSVSSLRDLTASMRDNYIGNISTDQLPSVDNDMTPASSPYHTSRIHTPER